MTSLYTTKALAIAAAAPAASARAGRDRSFGREAKLHSALNQGQVEQLTQPSCRADVVESPSALSTRQWGGATGGLRRHRGAPRVVSERDALRVEEGGRIIRSARSVRHHRRSTAGTSEAGWVVPLALAARRSGSRSPRSPARRR